MHGDMNKTSTDPISRYREMIDCDELKEDALQAHIVGKLQDIHLMLAKHQGETDAGLLSKLFTRNKPKEKQKGLQRNHVFHQS